MTDVFEGSIIRAMRRLEELLREMAMASKAIGNIELENKFSEGLCVRVSPCVCVLIHDRYHTHQARHCLRCKLVSVIQTRNH
jgi:hypothetical protein